MADQAPFSQIVVIGSSAGGIDALTTLVRTIPTDFPAPIVIAQHLDPSRESHLGEILNRASILPVRTLSEYERLEPGVIYVVPANWDVEITDHDIRLLRGSRRSQPSIDRLFTSAAEIFGENLIAVVLTGTGNDGAAGALEVQGTGGTVIIQDPLTASFPALPRALSPAAVDFVIPLQEIGPHLYEMLTEPDGARTDDDEEALTRVLRLLQERHGVDFRSYKPSTIMRRVQRRMAATGMPTISEYRQYIGRHPEEQQALMASLLIKVTKFFRDPDLFQALRERIMPDIVDAARQRDHTLRIWSAGCATGEEAYSLAILLAEVLGDELEQFHVRIFATDLDSDAITFARHGLYPPGSLAGLEPAIVERYFDAMDGGYQISKRLRSLTVFGEHDLAERAPFPRIDLVLCRNVLIYFTAELQRRILQLFAFSLRDGGYLVLGKSESATPLAGAFMTDDTRLKIFRRRGDQSVIPAAPVRDLASSTPPRVAPSRPSLYARGVPGHPPTPREQPYALRTDGVLFDLPAGAVVVDRRYDIQYINDAARTFLGIHNSALGEDLIHLVQTVHPSELRALIDRTFAAEIETVGIVSAIDDSAETRRQLEVVGKPTTGGGDAAPMVTLCFWDVSQRMEERAELELALERAREEQERAEQQRSHLAATNRELLSANQQLAREVAELRSQNEEFLVGNEELQAATEEVETLNEELQATNEELETLNEELQATVEELNTTNDDLQTRNVEIQDLAVRLEAARSRLQTVLNSLPDALVLLDGEGKTALTNARYDQLFAAPLETIDVRGPDGRALPGSESLQRRGTRGESFRVTVAAAGADGKGHLYEVTGSPLHGAGDERAGGLLVFRQVLDGSPLG